jgi:hypothetical protein
MNGEEAATHRAPRPRHDQKMEASEDQLRLQADPSQRTAHPVVPKRWRVNGGTEPKPDEALIKKCHQWCTLRPESSSPDDGHHQLQLMHRGYHEQPKQRLQGSNDTAMPPPPDPKIGSRVSPAVRCGTRSRAMTTPSRR